MILTILIFIITLLVLVVIHELGHFLMARKFNIKVEEFGFGIPPRAWGKKWGETLVSINWLPFGGFVRLLGEDEADKKVRENKRSFAAAAVEKRIVVVVAGVVMNLILAWILFYGVLGLRNFKAEFPLLIPHQFVGVQQKNEPLIIIQKVNNNSPAEEAGILAGQKITKVNENSIDQISDFSATLKSLAGKEVKLTLQSLDETETKEVVVTPRVDPPAGEGPLGIGLAHLRIARLEYETPIQKILSGPIHSVNLTLYSGKIMGSLIGESFRQKTIEPISGSVTGPVGASVIVNAIIAENKNPVLPLIDFMAILSLNLAIMNVLPFPALDGGRLFFLLIEAVTRKKVHAKVEKWVHTVGMAILLTLIMLITFSDIRKIFS